jgi:hypothetical protein
MKETRWSLTLSGGGGVTSRRSSGMGTFFALVVTPPAAK